MKRTVILFVAITVSLIISVSYAADKKKTIQRNNDAATNSAQSAQKAKYQLRKEPMKVSEDDSLKVFKLKTDEIEISGKKFTVWRPLEYIQNIFKDNGDGTISDTATGLMWQKSGADNSMTYDDAKVYIERLRSEKFAGYNDWRMPTVDELKSLLTPEKHIEGLYINTTIFDKNQQWCWTSDNHASGGAWIVAFSSGSVGWDSLDYPSNVRAVRSLTP